MGAIFGVGVAQEPQADGYLKGQIWNRPRSKPVRHLLFRIDLDGVLFGEFPLANYESVLDASSGFGSILAAPIHSPAAGGSPYPQKLIMQLETAKVFGFSSLDLAIAVSEFSPSAIPTVEVQWRTSPAQDLSGPEGARILTSVVGFPLADLIADGAPYYLIEWGGQPIYSYNNEDPPEADIGAFSRAAKISMQLMPDFATEVDSSTRYLADPEKKLSRFVGLDGWQRSVAYSDFSGTFASRVYFGCRFLLDMAALESIEPGEQTFTDVSVFPPPPWNPALWDTDFQYQSSFAIAEYDND